MASVLPFSEIFPRRDFPGSQGVRVWSLVGELRSHMLCGQKPKKHFLKIHRSNNVTNSIKTLKNSAHQKNLKKKKVFPRSTQYSQSTTLKKVWLYLRSHHLPVSQNLHRLPSFLYLHMLYLQSSTLLLFPWAPWCTKAVCPLTRNSPPQQQGSHDQRVEGEWWGWVSKESSSWLKLKSQPGDKAFRIRFSVWSKPPHHTTTPS